MKLALALYGHTDAGGFGKPSAKKTCVHFGFERLAEEWPGVFWHKKTRSMLIVYVDDFKLAARHGEHDALWKSIRQVIDMDPETLDGRFLGCSHERFTTSARRVHDLLDNHPACHPRQKQGVRPRRKTGPPRPPQLLGYTTPTRRYRS